MNYATKCPEDFTHPKTAFFLGFILWVTILLSEVLNIIKSQTYESISQLIGSYITFRVSISLPNMYYDAMTKPGVRIFTSLDKVTYLRRKYRDIKRPRYNIPI